MGAIWRGRKNSFLQQVTGGVRLEQAYRPSDEFMAGDVPVAVETQRQLGSRLRNHL